ncbi:hypothetical protein P152DRAFT_485939 [Eremomyces bilateralis CBS 781.70]|uniref:DUF7726 domain-containing protein n=1 Tax=Eremomyces bilateralis CBS 781.70 TaxID=1392243 RepID=A0A6G1FQ84_9PEZI|nr:uncharacterized protein P152DRAFT_485939 [Eremomyces bilateralis CBS 781.70]KAF1807812.1 hypothetical protein P152DRAFT_485939 [Eremomyces bilateralis CBS 781.70]
MSSKRESLVVLDMNRLYSVGEIRAIIEARKADLKKQGMEVTDDTIIQWGEKKRKSDVASLDDKASAESPDEYSDEDEPISIKENCDQIRSKINTFIDNGGMKVTEFQEVIGVSASSYYGFMKQKGKDKGSSSGTYIKAAQFFQKREPKRLPMPKKRKVSDSKAASGEKNPEGAAPKANNMVKSKNSTALDISSISLDGEDTDSVPIFDSPGEIRRKISLYLRKDCVTQAAFLRELHAQMHGPRKLARMQSSQLTNFRGKREPMGGNQSGIYYAAYVFFEKQRLAANKPKSQHRLEMEEVWGGRGGVDVKRNLVNQRILCMPNQRPSADKFGRVLVVQR